MWLLETVFPIALSAARIGNRTYCRSLNTYHFDPLLLQTIDLSGLFFTFLPYLQMLPTVGSFLPDSAIPDGKKFPRHQALIVEFFALPSRTRYKNSWSLNSLLKFTNSIPLTWHRLQEHVRRDAFLYKRL